MQLNAFDPVLTVPAPFVIHDSRGFLQGRVHQITSFLRFLVEKLAALVKYVMTQIGLRRPMVHDEIENRNPRVNFESVPRFKEFSLDSKSPYKIVDHPGERATFDRQLLQEYSRDFLTALTTLENRLQEAENRPNPKDLIYYPIVLRKCWEENSPDWRAQDLDPREHKRFFAQMQEHFIQLSALMEKYKGHHEFIYSCLKQIDLFLAQKIFPDESLSPALSEGKKERFLGFHYLFSIVNSHISSIKNRDPQHAQLVCNLKIRFANLPIADSVVREEPLLPLYLSSVEQLTHCIKYFRSEESQAVNELAQEILRGAQFPSEQVKRIRKFTSKKTSRLGAANRLILRKALFRKEKVSSGERKRRLSALTGTGWYASSDKTMHLWRVSTARQFFEDQLSRPEEQVQIPHWYHATPTGKLVKIIQSAVLKVLKEGSYLGFWFAATRLPSYGPNGFAMNGDFIGDRVNIKTRHEDNIWRGLFADVSLRFPRYGRPTIVYLGVEKKTDKLDVRQRLRVQKLPLKVFSTAQIDFMNEKVLTLVGRPNLPETWWG